MALFAVGPTTYRLNNKILSIVLLAGFPLLLLFIIGAFFAFFDTSSYGLYAQYFSNGAYKPETGSYFAAGWRGIRQYGHWAFIIAAVWFTIAWFFHGRMMRAATGSKPITRRDMPQIYNMLENLCISRGIPMPQFEIIDSPAMNAFASGINVRTYKIVLTRGIIERLQPDELEAVIAHELTHIMNNDVRLLIVSVIFVGMISFLCEFMYRTMFYGRNVAHYAVARGGRRNGKNQTAGIFIALAILAIGYVFSLLIRFALSRRREYLADAGAVELTKNPEAMMRALMRISGHDDVKSMPADIRQMCIVNNVKFMGLFATHPPIETRIAAISRISGTPVPALPVSLKRAPRRPWDQA